MQNERRAPIQAPHRTPAMARKDPQTPTIQVLERMLALLDMLAAHQDPVSLKAISERT